MEPPPTTSSAGIPSAEPECGTNIPLTPLCNNCRNLFERPDEDLEDHFRVVYDDRASAVPPENCHVCATVNRQATIHETRPPTRSLIRAPYPDFSSFYLVVDTVEENQVQPTAIMEFFPAMPGASTPSIRLDPVSHSHGRDAIAITPNLDTENTGQEQCFHTIRKWVNICLSEHKLCKRAKEGDTTVRLPTRLIDVRDGLRLIDTGTLNMPQGETRYATLSHKWRQERSIQLLRSNLETLSEKIESESLPPVFGDAVDVVRRLGIDYIWIDALCIVQDDPNDWTKEAALMGSVYQDAALNIGASAAAQHDNSSLGLFITRDKTSFAMSHVTIKRRAYSEPHFGFPRNLFTNVHQSEPMLARGWIVQERTLSPRSIYFGGQLTWECPELLANETFPQDSPAFKNIGIELSGPLRLARLLRDLGSSVLEYANGFIIKQTYHKWLHLVQKYRHCNLTFTSDTLPALAGLVHKFQEELKDEYLAGLWRTDILRGIMWVRCLEPCCKIADRPLDRYRGKPVIDNLLMLLAKRRTADICVKAPSWSWAATDSPIKFMHLWDFYPPENEAFLAELHNVTVTASSNMTGPISSGRIELSAILRSNTSPFLNASVHAGVDTFQYHIFEAYDWKFDDKGIPGYMNSFFVVLTYQTVNEFSPNTTKVRGLIVQPTGKPAEYRRGWRISIGSNGAT